MTILTACLVGLWGVSTWMSRDRHAQSSGTVWRGKIEAFPRPVVVSVLLCLATAELGTEWWYRTHENARPKVSAWSIDWPTRAEAWRSVPIAEDAEQLLRFNDGGGGQWQGSDSHPWNMFFFRWLPGRTAGLFIKNHRPDICLPASGMVQRGEVSSQVLEINGVPLPMRSYVFEHGSETFHVFYCYWDGTAPSAIAQNDENWTAGGRLRAVQAGKRDIGTQMLELIVRGYESDRDAENAAREELSRIIKPDGNAG